MKKNNVEDIKILIADNNRQLCSSLKGVLHHYGFRRVLNATDADAFEDMVHGSNPDLILCDLDLKGGDVCNMIWRLRHNRFGLNPFSAVILFIEEANEDIVKMAAQAGLDDLQVKPVVPEKIIRRVEYLIEKRKPFVVTTDYIGPDRRKSPRTEGQQVPLMDVPNTLALKAAGKYEANRIQKEILKSFWAINAQKIERHIFQVSYLVERIVPAYHEGRINRESLEHVTRLMQVAHDIVDRLEDSDFKHIVALAETLVTVAKSLWESGTLPKGKDLELLPELSAALSATFMGVGASNNTVQMIQSSIREKYQK